VFINKRTKESTGGGGAAQDLKTSGRGRKCGANGRNQKFRDFFGGKNSINLSYKEVKPGQSSECEARA